MQVFRIWIAAGSRSKSGHRDDLGIIAKSDQGRERAEGFLSCHRHALMHSDQYCGLEIIERVRLESASSVTRPAVMARSTTSRAAKTWLTKQSSQVPPTDAPQVQLGARGALGASVLLGLGDSSEDMFRPVTRLREGVLPRGLASRCMDTSDGFVATIDQLARINEVGVVEPLPGLRFGDVAIDTAALRNSLKLSDGADLAQFKDRPRLRP